MKSSVDRVNARALLMFKMIIKMSIIRIDATKNAAQISFRTGQLSLSEKKTPPPPPFPDTNAAHQLRLMVFNI